MASGPSVGSDVWNSDSIAADPAGYLFTHQSAAPPPSPLEALAQQDWSYFQSNISPIQQKLFRTAMSPQTYQNNVAQAKSDVDSQYSGLPNAFKRNLQGMGIAPSAAQTAAFGHEAAVSKGLAEAGAMNAARQQTTAQAKGILGV